MLCIKSLQQFHCLNIPKLIKIQDGRIGAKICIFDESIYILTIFQLQSPAIMTKNVYFVNS